MMITARGERWETDADYRRERSLDLLIAKARTFWEPLSEFHTRSRWTPEQNWRERETLRGLVEGAL